MPKVTIPSADNSASPSRKKQRVTPALTQNLSRPPLVDCLESLISPFVNSPSATAEKRDSRNAKNGIARPQASLVSPASVPRQGFENAGLGFWQQEVHQGVKSKRSRLPASCDITSEDEAQKNAAPSAVFITRLSTEAGRTYHITQTLAEGAHGKFRIAAWDGHCWGAKEYRLVDKGPGHTLAVSKNDIEQEWAASQAHNPELRVHDMVQCDQKVFVMTNLFGQDLTSAACRVSVARRPTFVRGALLDIAQTLAKMHASRELHLDVKPANALVGSGFVTLCDFGCAVALHQLGPHHIGRGTPAFFAPERWRGLTALDGAATIDETVDVWSLAVSWSHMHQIAAPFDRWDLDSLGNTLRSLNAYELFLAQVMSSPGAINKDLITQRALEGLNANCRYDDQNNILQEFYDWAAAGLRVDDVVFSYLLSGPLQASPSLRPGATDVVQFLHSTLRPRDVNMYSAITRRLLANSEYRIARRDVGGLSSQRSCTLQKAKSDLDASYGNLAQQQ